ncbi:hypothetical protein AB0395_34965 [Streptosporangium sp. NPDC051023]|uniref:hypothetical protein n=1 Tax=Streptosporangium sp. NPDC051023 TaxID=3155410 RepID=UPI00344DF64F
MGWRSAHPGRTLLSRTVELLARILLLSGGTALAVAVWIDDIILAAIGFLAMTLGAIGVGLVLLERADHPQGQEGGAGERQCSTIPND